MKSRISNFITGSLLLLLAGSLFGQDTTRQVKQDTLIEFPVELLSDAKGIYIAADTKYEVLQITVEGEVQYINNTTGKAYLVQSFDKKGKLLYLNSGTSKKLYHIAKKDAGYRVKNIPLWLSVLPPLLAILMALILKEVVVSLFSGIWLGAFIVGGLRIDSLYYFLQSFYEVISKFVLAALNDSDHMAIIVFSILIGGMVAIISKNGGMVGVVLKLSKYAKGPKSSQFITYLLGIIIFFDDYANTLIVGNTMRPVTDKYKISREKLSYLVDATAAPVAAIAFVTTWIGAELGYIDDGLKAINLSDEYTPYGVFISSLKYAFYSILTLIFMAILIYTQKDFGPMYKAEKRARTTGQVSFARTKDEDEPNMEDLTPVAKAPKKWYHAALPVITVVLVTILGLLDTGLDNLHADMDGIAQSWGPVWNNIGVAEGQSFSFFRKIGIVIGASNSYTALIWASLSGLTLSIIITVSARIMSLFDTMHWMVNGFKTMLPALIILILAWSLAKTTENLHTADFMSEALTGNVSPYLLPTLTFMMAALIAFSTGSSWSTMAILYPIIIPATYAVAKSSGMPENQIMELLYSVIATVLSASVLGDHCSPISDTTILSSLASDCNHMDHVNTQMPYALTVGLAAILGQGVSTLAGGGVIPAITGFAVSISLLVFVIHYFGKKTDE
jgi:Na+/H+ antiporter NhaC